MAVQLDDLSRRYVELGFGLERHIEGTVDAYVGPPAIRDAVMTGPISSPADLLDRATLLLADIGAADLPPSRTDYLSAQVSALHTTCRKLTGDPIGYRDEVRACFDIEPARIPESTYEDAIAAIGDALPGTGEIPDRMIAWRARFEVPADTARFMIETILTDIRARAAQLAPLPEGESVEVSMVRDKPWSGYNWYLGNARSLVEINTDMPVRANALLDLVCHEAYPGHHTEHAIKDIALYQGKGYGEHSIQLINTPECVMSEGIATLAASIIFTPEEASIWSREHLYGPAGIEVDPQQERQVAESLRILKSVAGNAALLLHEDGASEREVVHYLMRYGLESETRAQHRMRFISDPLWRAYVFTYHVGHDLLGRWLDRAEDEGVGNARPHRQARFARLLAEQVTPSAIASELA